MPAFSSQAPGKAILFGEHAVVYGQPAIAIPVFQRRAASYILANPHGVPDEVQIEAPDIQLEANLAELDDSHPFKIAIRQTMKRTGIESIPACRIRVVSSIPISSGLGSGAAIAVSLARTLSRFLGHELPAEEISAIAFEVDKIYHGTPSGIDNTVIAYEKPVFFIKGQPAEFISPNAPLDLLIAGTGLQSSTRDMVLGLRARWDQNKSQYDRLFAEIGSLSKQARALIEAGDLNAIGALMTGNQELLKELGVSHPKLDTLVEAALQAGALGAKLSGAGGGGNMIALLDPVQTEPVQTALWGAGAVDVFATRVDGRK